MFACSKILNIGISKLAKIMLIQLMLDHNSYKTYVSSAWLGSSNAIKLKKKTNQAKIC